MVTIGALQAGTKENVIPDEAIIKLNVRLSTKASANACSPRSSGSSMPKPPPRERPKPPEITPLDRYSLVSNDPEATKRVGDAFRQSFPADTSCRSRADIGERGLRIVRRAVGRAVRVLVRRRHRSRRVREGAKRQGALHEIPTNHNPRFAPVIHPTLETGVEALVVAAQGLARRRKVP